MARIDSRNEYLIVFIIYMLYERPPGEVSSSLFGVDRFGPDPHLISSCKYFLSVRSLWLHVMYTCTWSIKYINFEWKKEEIWLSPMTEALTPTEQSKKQRDNTKNATKNFDYTTIADRLRTVSWGNDSHPAGVVKPVYGIPTFPLTAKAV